MAQRARTSCNGPHRTRPRDEPRRRSSTLGGAGGVAGAANALYGLGLDDAGVSAFATSLMHASPTAAEAVDGLSLTVTLHHDCDGDRPVFATPNDES